MNCSRCPHHVRHGKLGDGDQIEFFDHCGLMLRQNNPIDLNVRKTRGRGKPAPAPVRKQPLAGEIENTACLHYPFSPDFDHLTCEFYRRVFDSSGQRNTVVPSTELGGLCNAVTGGSVADMDFL